MDLLGIGNRYGALAQQNGQRKAKRELGPLTLDPFQKSVQQH